MAMRNSPKVLWTFCIPNVAEAYTGISGQLAKIFEGEVSKLRDEEKTKEQLIGELGELRQQVAEIETPEAMQNTVEEQIETSLRYGSYQYRAHYIRQRIRGLLWS